ncbi:tRNA U-34 5-methylaminomethyl-2-thiouridine biosynthesis protein [Psychrobacillus sp. FSL H8-0484]|uniref:tRNA U-34 5-methylaminomethyl-2-thiouridine biosynthesis protein n=1 Tax=Psychrobacillus sp. FSL H8-0484 TaxID=2921390 RepID=UPI0030F8BDFE
MKILFYSILGSLIGWLIWGVFTNDYSPNGYGLFLSGLISGFLIGRRNPKEETE